jgi:hypothetical protein
MAVFKEKGKLPKNNNPAAISVEDVDISTG